VIHVGYDAFYHEKSYLDPQTTLKYFLVLSSNKSWILRRNMKDKNMKNIHQVDENESKNLYDINSSC